MLSRFFNLRRKNLVPQGDVSLGISLEIAGVHPELTARVVFARVLEFASTGRLDIGTRTGQAPASVLLRVCRG